MICTDCIHKDVCGLEGSWDEALITCKHKTELPHNMGHWITDKFGQVICSECNGMRRDNRIYHIAYCNKCGAKMD